MKKIVGLVATAACAATLGACSSMDSLDMAGGAYGASSGGPGMGATQGGVQDMSFARELVDQGQVPPPEAFLVEGMFSEHDLPLEGEPCTTTLCLRAAMGIAPSASDEPAAWLQVGMSSTVDPNNFERPSLAVIATVDVSGSMGWSYGENGAPAAIIQELLLAIAAELDEGDRFTMVTYGNVVQQAVPWVFGDDPGITTAINAIGEGG